MNLQLWVRGGLVALLAFGCVADPESGGDAASGDAQIDLGILLPDMAGAGGEGGSGDDMGGPGGAGGGADMGEGGGGGGVEMDADVPDMRPPRDMMVAVEVTTCQQACDRYAECEQLGAQFGDEAACLADCERAARTGPPEEWWTCVSEESCNLLRLCPLPRVEALACDEVCARFDTCGVDLPIGECQAACEASDAPFRACGEHIFGACDTEAFQTCLVRDVYPSCGSTCDDAVQCNIIDRAPCELECLGRRSAGDALTELRSAQLRQCLAGAGEDCVAVHTCFNPPNAGEGQVNEAQFCAAYADCGLGEVFSCQELYGELGSAAARQCAHTSMLRACPFSGFDLLEECAGGGGIDPRLLTCTRFCEGMDVCDRLEGNRIDCINACSGNQAADPDEAERNDAQLGCGSAFSCPELDQCLAEVGPAGACTALCGSLAACELADEACLETCDAEWPRDRHAAYRDCVAAAGEDCEAVAACTIDPRVPCDRFCQTLVDCGEAVPASCATECDDAHFAQPLEVTLTVACALSAGACEAPAPARSVAACLEDPGAQGSGCYNYCRAVTECDPENGDALVTCLTECVEGFGDATGLTYAAASDCLEAAPVGAACEVLRGCLPEAPPAVDCEALCAQVGACSIPAEGCVAQCAEMPNADVAGCVADAVRVGAQCAGVAACWGYEPPPADPTCTDLCDARRACEGDLDPYLCRLACTPTPPEAAFQLACAQAAVCPELPACLALEAVPNPDCAEPCQAAVECGAFADLDACNAVCTGRDASPRTPEDFTAGLPVCLAAAAEGEACDAEAARTCFDAALCEFTDQVIILPGAGGRVQVNTNGLPSAGRAGCGGGGPQAVIAITLNRAANVTFETTNNQYDTLIHVRSACDDAATELACNDDGGAGVASRISQQLQPGTYFLFVDGFAGGSGTTDVVVTVQ